mmetsp:Transcript_18802/g.28002  ORF Transcript_18802/g.28002 Transcript_18802/m.28002 type:complete len:153 (+) Transcript_18802:101-559(+)
MASTSNHQQPKEKEESNFTAASKGRRSLQNLVECTYAILKELSQRNMLSQSSASISLNTSEVQRERLKALQKQYMEHSKDIETYRERTCGLLLEYTQNKRKKRTTTTTKKNLQKLYTQKEQIEDDIKRKNERLVSLIQHLEALQIIASQIDR